MLYPTGFILGPKGSVRFCVVNFDRLTGIPLVCGSCIWHCAKSIFRFLKMWLMHFAMCQIYVNASIKGGLSSFNSSVNVQVLKKEGKEVLFSPPQPITCGTLSVRK